MFGVLIADPRILPHGWEPWEPAFAVLHLTAVVLFVAVALAWGRHGRRGLLVASGFLTVAAIAMTYIAMVRPGDIPIDWITIIHESLGHKAIRHLYASAVHAGPSFAFVVSAIAAGPAANLRDVVWLNLLLALVNAVIFCHIALRVTGPLWALVWTLVFALNPATFLASFSELPTNLLGLYFLAGAIAWATLNDALPQPAIIRWAAFALCAMLTLFTGLTRTEVAAVGALALTLHVAYAVLGEDQWAAAQRRLLDAGRRTLVYLTDRPALVVALCVLGVWLSKAGLPFALLGRSEVTGLYPFSSFVYSLFFFLPMMLLPIGVSIATFLGFIHAIKHFRWFGGVVLSLFVVVRMYFVAQDQYYETGRYLSFVLPAIFLLALFGREQLNEITRDWHPTWQRAAQLGFLIAWFGRPLPGMPDFYHRPEYHREAGFSQLLLDLNMQREVRHLLAVTEKNPECVFVGRVVENYSYPDRPPEYAYAFFGQPVPAAIFVSEKDASLDTLIARYAPGAACVRLYYGGDCNLTTTDRCTQFVAGRRLIDEERFWSRLYNNPHDYGYGAPEIVLATYAWP